MELQTEFIWIIESVGRVGSVFILHFSNKIRKSLFQSSQNICLLYICSLLVSFHELINEWLDANESYFKMLIKTIFQ